MLAAGVFERLSGAANREVIGLGAAAGEHHLGRFGAHQRGHGCARLVQGRLCLLPVVMNTRRIAEKVCERSRHRLGDGRIDRGGRVVIEVNAHGSIDHVSIAGISANPQQNKG